MPTIAKEPLSVEPVPATSVKVCVSAGSGSVAESVPTVVPEAWFSATVELESAMSVGCSLTLLTEIVKTFSNVSRPLSVARTRIE